MSRSIAVTSALIFLLAAIGCAGPGTHVGRATERVSVKKPVQSFTLENGMTLIVKNTGEGTPTSIQVWVAGGSASDPDGKPGLAHLVEHLLFSGSLHVPKGRAEQYLEGMGGRLTGNTGRDYSYIGVTLPGEGWDRAMDILFDLTAYPSFRADQVESQKRVVAQEINEDGREMDDLLMRNFFDESFKVHPYKHPVTGFVKDTSALTRDDAAFYYSKTYVPSNLALVVVGDVKPGEVRNMANSTFGRLVPVKSKPSASVQEPYQLYSRTKSVDGPVSLTYMAIGWHICAATDQDIYPIEVLGAALGEGRGARLYMELRERMGIVYDVDVDIFPMKDPGVFVITAQLTDPDVRRAVDETLRQLDKLKNSPLSADEIDRALNAIEAARQPGNQPADDQAYALGYWATVYGGKEPDGYIDNIRKVTPEDVQRVAQKYLGAGNYTLSVIRP